MPRNVLSIDWDFFTGDCLAGPGCVYCSWKRRCCGNDKPRQNSSQARNKRLERNVTNVFQQRVLKKNGYRVEGAKLIVAECHADIYRFLRCKDFVVNIDAHDDETSAYIAENVSCGNWASIAQDWKRISDYYWIGTTHKRIPRLQYNLVFLCLSRPWTPRELDYLFFRMVRQWSRRTGSEPRFVGPWCRHMQALYHHFDEHGFSKRAATSAPWGPLGEVV